MNRILRFARKPARDKWAAVSGTVRHLTRRGPPKDQLYITCRPDAEFVFDTYPELADLRRKWTHDNQNNVGDTSRLYALAMNVKHVLGTNVTGDIAELGVFRGNSAAVLAHYGREFNRHVWLFDTFEGFDNRDLKREEAPHEWRFTDTSLSRVIGLVGQNGVSFVRGRFPESIPPNMAELFSIVHIDCDLYEPMKAGLVFFYPRLSAGGLLIIHDYANPHWPGIKRAVDEFCEEIPERPIIFGDKSGTAMLRKTA